MTRVKREFRAVTAPRVVLTTIVGLLVAYSPSVHAQMAPKTQWAFPADRDLTQMEKSLPTGWKIVRAAQTFKIVGPDQVWLIHENRINAPPGQAASARRKWLDRQARWKKLHMALDAPVRPEFRFRYEPRWSPAKLRSVRQRNAAILKQIRAIVAKINSRGKRGADAYRRQTESLREKLVPLPYNTQRHALYVDKTVGVEDGFTYVFPGDAAARVFKVWQKVLHDLNPLRLENR